MKTMERKSFSK